MLNNQPRHPNITMPRPHNPQLNSSNPSNSLPSYSPNQPHNNHQQHQQHQQQPHNHQQHQQQPFFMNQSLPQNSVARSGLRTPNVQNPMNRQPQPQQSQNPMNQSFSNVNPAFQAKIQRFTEQQNMQNDPEIDPQFKHQVQTVQQQSFPPSQTQFSPPQQFSPLQDPSALLNNVEMVSSPPPPMVNSEQPMNSSNFNFVNQSTSQVKSVQDSLKEFQTQTRQQIQQEDQLYQQKFQQQFQPIQPLATKPSTQSPENSLFNPQNLSIVEGIVQTTMERLWAEWKRSKQDLQEETKLQQLVQFEMKKMHDDMGQIQLEEKKNFERMKNIETQMRAFQNEVNHLSKSSGGGMNMSQSDMMNYLATFISNESGTLKNELQNNLNERLTQDQSIYLNNFKTIQEEFGKLSRKNNFFYGTVLENVQVYSEKKFDSQTIQMLSQGSVIRLFLPVGERSTPDGVEKWIECCWVDENADQPSILRGNVPILYKGKQYVGDFKI